jgi:uncharacterized protein YpmS
MNWGEVIFSLLTLAGVFVLVVILFVLKSEKKSRKKKLRESKANKGERG